MNRQSASKALTIEQIQEQSSTTIPQGSRLLEYLKVETPNIMFRNVFSNCYYKTSCIYIFFNTKTSNCYIGSTRNLQKRLSYHRKALLGKHWNYKFRMIKQYAKYFYVGILEQTDNLEERELYFIKLFKSLFDDLLLNISMDTQRNFGKGGLWQKKIEKRKRLISRPIYCYDLSGKFLKKYNSVSEVERRLKITRSNIKKCLNGKTRYLKTFMFRDSYAKRISMPISKRHDIACRNIDSMKKKLFCIETNKVYESIIGAERELKIPNGTIYGCIKRKMKYKNKYTFQYYKDIV